MRKIYLKFERVWFYFKILWKDLKIAYYTFRMKRAESQLLKRRMGL